MNLPENALTLPPVSLYIHIPWCVRKCPYCDFNSHESRDIPEADYINCLLDDLRQDQHLAQGRRIQTIFFGGGTPSLFSPEGLARLLTQTEETLGFADDIEITLEANPGTVDQQRFQGFRAAGINRLSLGIQSFDPAQLTALGRIHDDRLAHQAIVAARAAGFDNLNLDIMFGLPQQSMEGALADLATACQYQPEHLSWYQLTIEPNTVFYSRPPSLPDDDCLWDMQQAGQRLLAEQGYRQYEISAYARDLLRCRHNLNYWQFGDYLAIGAGAHGKITLAEQRQVVRYQKTRLPRDYLNLVKPYTAERRTLSVDDLRFDFLLNAMRLAEGVPARCFTDYTGLPLQALGSAWQKAITLGLVAESPERLQASAKGQQYLNNLLSLFLPE